MMRVCIVRLELDSSLVFAHRSGQIDFAKEEDFAEREVSFRETGIKAESFEGGIFGLSIGFAPVRARVKGRQNMCAR